MITVYAAAIGARREAYALLDLAARERWGLSPRPEIVREERGKPRYRDLPDCHFNLSHSGGMALCALGDGPVGADIQRVAAHRPGLPGRVCSPEELSWLEDGDRWDRFAQIWALKEALGKFRGTGLTLPICEMEVPLPTAGPGLYRRGGLWFRLYEGDGWWAAVCAESAPPEKICWPAL